ncbi:hypothetical protein NL676_036229 [Syzygium grande]|nr:hypothetical protein NL676_036229 [Syzygium grande]
MLVSVRQTRNRVDSGAGDHMRYTSRPVLACFPRSEQVLERRTDEGPMCNHRATVHGTRKWRKLDLVFPRLF